MFLNEHQPLINTLIFFGEYPKLWLTIKALILFKFYQMQPDIVQAITQRIKKSIKCNIDGRGDQDIICTQK